MAGSDLPPRAHAPAAAPQAGLDDNPHWQMYQQLRVMTENMLQLARQEHWDALQDMQASQQAMLHSLPALDEITLNAMDDNTREAIAQTLHKIDTDNQEIIARVRAWQDEITRILGQLATAQHNVSRLERAYRP